MSEDHRQILLKGARDRQFAPDEIVFREGEPANALYLIECGEVAVEARCDGEFRHIQTLGAGDVLGWSWLFPPFAWHFQARATQPTRMIVCDGGHLLVQAEENPPFGYALMKRITQILIHRLQATRRTLVKTGSAPAGSQSSPG